MLEILRCHQLYAKLSKCVFWIREKNILGHKVTTGEESVDPKKIEAVAAWEQPKNVFEIRSLSGLSGYYRRFMKDFSHVAAPMTRLIVKGSDSSVMPSVRKHSSGMPSVRKHSNGMSNVGCQGKTFAKQIKQFLSLSSSFLHAMRLCFSNYDINYSHLFLGRDRRDYLRRP